MQLQSIVSYFHTLMLLEAMLQNPSDLLCKVSALEICSSAILALYYTHNCAKFDDVSGQGTTEQLSIQKASLDGLHQLAPAISQFASKLTIGLQSGAQGGISDPFVTQSCYAVAKLCLWSANGSGDVKYMEYFDILKEALRVIGQRLHIAGKSLLFYLRFVTSNRT